MTDNKDQCQGPLYEKGTCVEIRGALVEIIGSDKGVFVFERRTSSLKNEFSLPANVGKSRLTCAAQKRLCFSSLVSSHVGCLMNAING